MTLLSKLEHLHFGSKCIYRFKCWRYPKLKLFYWNNIDWLQILNKPQIGEKVLGSAVFSHCSSNPDRAIHSGKTKLWLLDGHWKVVLRPKIWRFQICKLHFQTAVFTYWINVIMKLYLLLNRGIPFWTNWISSFLYNKHTHSRQWQIIFNIAFNECTNDASSPYASLFAQQTLLASPEQLIFNGTLPEISSLQSSIISISVADPYIIS